MKVCYLSLLVLLAVFRSPLFVERASVYRHHLINSNSTFELSKLPKIRLVDITTRPEQEIFDYFYEVNNIDKFHTSSGKIKWFANHFLSYSGAVYIQYFAGDITYGEVKGIDPETFEYFDKYYAKDKSGVYYISDSHDIKNVYLIDGADLQTFQELPSGLGRDRNYIYFRGIESSYSNLNFSYIDHYYWKDDSGVFFRHRKIDEADPESFRVTKKDIEVSCYDPTKGFYDAEDKDNVFIMQKKADGRDFCYALGDPNIVVLDKKTFEWHEENEFSDKNNRYYRFGDGPIKNYKLDSERVGIYLFKDSNFVYKIDYETGESSVIQGAKPESFTEFANTKCKDITYFIDDENVYDEYGWILNLDPNSLYVFESCDFVKDNETLYESFDASGVNIFTKVEEVDINTFIDYPGFYAKDKNRVYYFFNPKNSGPIVLEDVDLETFRPVNCTKSSGIAHRYDGLAVDKNKVYRKGQEWFGDPDTFCDEIYYFEAY